MSEEKKSHWSEIQNTYLRYTNEIRKEEGDMIAAITIDAWKTADLEEPGKVLADVLLSKKGDILVSYRDTLALYDDLAQEKIQEAKVQLKELYKHRNPDNTIEPNPTEPKTRHVTKKLPPERLALWNNCLGKTPVEISDLYGALCDINPELWFDFGHKYSGFITLRIPDEDHEKTDLVLDFFKRGEQLIKEKPVSEVLSAVGDFRIETEHDGIFTMTVEEAPELKREGNSFVFKTQSSEPELRERNDQICTILRALDPKTEYEPLAIGELMYSARFKDGFEENVFESELSAEPVKEQSSSIDTIISDAQTRQGKSPADSSKDIER